MSLTLFAAYPVVAAMTASTNASAQMVPIPIAVEMVAVIVASASGALAAREHKLDYIGAIGLAVVVALGGGLIRDIILQEGDVYILKQPLALLVSIITATATFVFPRMVEKPDRLVAVLDIFAVGLFAVMGADKTMAYGYGALTCIMMGFFTAVGGGAIRDICLAQVPYIFRRSNLYAIAAIAGAAAYVVLTDTLGVWNVISACVCVALTMLVRWISIHFNIMSPTEVDLTPVVRPIKRAGSRTIQTVSKHHRRHNSSK